MSRTKIFRLFQVLLILLFLLSPSLAAADLSFLKDFLFSVDGPLEEEEFYKILPLKPSGSFSLRNVNGNITITTWAEEKVEIKAVKSTRYGREMLDKVTIEIDSSTHFVSVDTVYARQRNIRVNVSYEVKVPQGVNLQRVRSVNGSLHLKGPFTEVKANTTNGNVVLSRASGETYISTTNGKIEAEKLKGKLEAKTVNGSIDLELQDFTQDVKVSTVNGSVKTKFSDLTDLNAFLNVKTVNGRISCDFPVTLNNFRVSKHNLEGQMGKGGPEIYLRTVNGSIKIYR